MRWHVPFRLVYCLLRPKHTSEWLREVGHPFYVLHWHKCCFFCCQNSKVDLYMHINVSCTLSFTTYVRSLKYSQILFTKNLGFTIIQIANTFTFDMEYNDIYDLIKVYLFIYFCLSAVYLHLQSLDLIHGMWTSLLYFDNMVNFYVCVCTTVCKCYFLCYRKSSLNIQYHINAMQVTSQEQYLISIIAFNSMMYFYKGGGFILGL